MGGRRKTSLSQDKPKTAKLNAFVEDDLRIRLYHALLDDRLSFSEWLRQQIHAYLAEKERGPYGGIRRRG